MADTALETRKRNKLELLDYISKNSAGGDVITTGTSVNINSLEDKKKAQAQAIKTENVERRQLYAERITKYGGNGFRTDREAAHNIVMEIKLDSGTKT